jgi:hypothetical protein
MNTAIEIALSHEKARQVFIGRKRRRIVQAAALARQERAERPRRAGIGLERGDPLGRAGVFRSPAPPTVTTKAARGERNRQAAGASIPWSPAGPGARDQVPRGSSGPATGAPLAGSARRAKVPGPANRVRAGRAPAYRDVCRSFWSRRRTVQTATVQFDRWRGRVKAGRVKVPRGRFKKRGLCA